MKYIVSALIILLFLTACERDEECSCTNSNLYCHDGECKIKPYIYQFGPRAGSVEIRTAYTAIGSFNGICSDTVVVYTIGEAPYYDLKIHTEYIPGFTDAQTQKTLMDDHLRIDFHYGLFCGPPPRNEVSNFHARVYQDSIVLEMGVAPWPDVFDEINEVTLLSWDLHKEKYDIDCPDC